MISVAVRHESVERFVTGWRSDLPEASRRETATIGQELGQSLDGHSRIWHVIDDSGIISTCDEIWQLVITVGLPYLERFVDLEKILEALSCEESPYCYHFPAIRCHHVPVIRALLYGAESAASAVQVEYLRLKQLDDPNAADYHRFVKHLEKHFGIDLPI